jgi:hypothetical protein
LVALLAGIDVEVEAGIEVVDESEVDDDVELEEADVAELELRCWPRPPRRFDIRPRASRFESTLVSI